MQILITVADGRMTDDIARLTGRPAVPAIMSESGAIANLNHGPAVLDQLAQQMDLHPTEMAQWHDLDQATKEELALLTVDSAPWVLDHRIHDSAADELSAETKNKLLEARQ